jgi:porphobilinogen deaminase
MELEAIVCSVDGQTAIRRHARGSTAHAGDLGRRVADELLRAGAGGILDDVRRTAAGRRHTEGT